MKSIKVGLLGLGTVGGGVVTLCARNMPGITRRTGYRIDIVQAATKPPFPQDLEGSNLIGSITEDAWEVVNNPEIEVVIELIGGYSPARELVLKAIENGKHVITANKAMIAKYGNEIFDAALKNGVTIGYEAAVAGGIPIIKSLREGLVANDIEWIAGIINGTGNYILTGMRQQNRSFADMLNEAQRLGYAEADPTFDVEGIDAAHKLTILASLAFGIPLQFERCYTEGIAKLDAEDVLHAGEFGYRIRHLGIARKTDKGIELRVHPTLIPDSRLIANVDGVMNAVLVKGNAVGPTLYYGAGAGALPTASAVVADLVDIIREPPSEPDQQFPHLGFEPDQLLDTPILDIDHVESMFYLRMRVVDKPGVMRRIASVLEEEDINIEVMKQFDPDHDKGEVTIVMITSKVVEQRMKEALARIIADSNVVGDIVRIRGELLSG